MAAPNSSKSRRKEEENIINTLEEKKDE